MEFNTIGNFIANVGFPIFIAAILLVYIDKKLEKLIEVIGELKLVIKTCLATGREPYYSHHRRKKRRF